MSDDFDLHSNSNHQENEIQDQQQQSDVITINQRQESKQPTLTKQDTFDHGIINIQDEQQDYNTPEKERIEAQSQVKFKQDNNQKEKIEQFDIQEREKIIQIKNCHKTYLLGLEGVAALRGVTFDIFAGEFICILGSSGGGKTTLLNLIGTIDKPTKGDITICGQQIKSNTEDTILASLRLSYLGFVFQSFNLINSLTALQNVELPMILKGQLSKKEIRERALSLLEDVGLLNRINHYPNQLSGGEQQRITICRALSNKPRILLLDEPTGDLDTKSTDVVMQILVDLNKKHGITMIMVTHDVNLKMFANRVIKMVDGKINNIERITESQRSKALGELQQNMKDGEDEQNAQQQLLGIRSGVDQTKQKEVIQIKPNTQVRKCGIYAVQSNAEKTMA